MKETMKESMKETMKENIPTLIAYCNKSIIYWYKNEFPKDLAEFTPVDKNNQKVIDDIYDMYLILKAETKSNKQLLIPVILYYFALSVVEYYVLECMCPLFGQDVIKLMFEFSMNPSLSKYRKRMLEFNQQPYQMTQIKNPYKFVIKTKK
jgi:hypothetical protein